ncbi:MAG: hypothetical protein ACFFAN_05510, partial [Promethearchaeota archaeon]
KKEYRLFLVLVIWLLIGFTLFQFNRTLVFAYIVFLPLLAICVVLFFVALILHKDLKTLSFKQIVIYCIIAGLIGLLFIIARLVMIITGIFSILLLIAIVSYVFITAIFYMYGCYRYGVEWDEKIYSLSSPLNHILRWTIFLGGTLLAVLITFFVSRIGISWAIRSAEIGNAFAWIAVIIMFLIIGLALIGGLFIFAGKLNAWLGIFFLFVALYTTYLMFNAFYALSTSGDVTYRLWIRICLYIFDVCLILYTVGTILGEKVEIISKKLKFVKSDAILMWLIFSKAAFEFANLGIEGMNVETFNAVVGFVLFIPLLFIAGLYGILSYGKMKKERKMKIDS